MNIRKYKSNRNPKTCSIKKRTAKRAGAILSAAVLSAVLGIGAAAEESLPAETAFATETESVPEISVPQMEIEEPKAETEKRDSAPAVKEETVSRADETPAPAPVPDPEPVIEEYIPETEERVSELTAVSEDGVMTAQVSKKDGTGYPVSESIRIEKKDASEQRNRIENRTAETYIASHQDIDWNEGNRTRLEEAVSEAVGFVSAYGIVKADGSPVSASENSLNMKVTDSGIFSMGGRAVVYTSQDMSEDIPASESINTGDRSFVPASDSFAIAVIRDVAFEPETEPAPEETETQGPAVPGETENVEGGESTQQEETGETENAGNAVIPENTDDENTGEGTESEAGEETETPVQEESREETEESGENGESQEDSSRQDMPEEERPLPVHPETAYFESDTEETYPTDSVDGPSPLVEEQADTASGAPGSSYIGETTAAEFSGLSNTEAAEKCLELVRRVDNSGIIPSVVAAQMILESGYVRTGLAQNANNCFGMKSSLSQNDWTSTWGGQSVNYQTWEQSPDGAISTPVCSFRVYDSIEQSILDHSGYLLEAKNGGAPRYPGITESRDYTTVASIIKAGGYATDINYVGKLCSIIQTYNLDRYDAETGYGAASPGESTGTASSQMR